MGNTVGLNRSRRSFVASLPPLLLGGLAVPCAAECLTGQEKPGFWAGYSPEEQRVIGASVMAQDLTNFIGNGYGCAECALGVGLNYLGEPREKLAAAAVFSGGFSQGDLCGFVTGSMMSIGIAAGKLHKDRQAMRDFARPRSQEYWRWWVSRGPLHCSELRQQYQGSEEFLRMGQRAVAKLEELIEPARSV